MSTMPRLQKTPQNLKDLRVQWNKAITKVDYHSLKCKACWTPRNLHAFAVTVGSLTEPSLEKYQPCGTAKKLSDAERKAMADYREAGGELPAD